MAGMKKMSGAGVPTSEGKTPSVAPKARAPMKGAKVGKKGTGKGHSGPMK